MTDLERTAFHIYILYQGRIQDFKLGGGGAVKKIAPSGGVFRVKNHYRFSKG